MANKVEALETVTTYVGELVATYSTKALKGGTSEVCDLSLKFQRKFYALVKDEEPTTLARIAAMAALGVKIEAALA